MGSEPLKVGRPRSEEARTAILYAVDDLLVEQGYSAVTLKGIAERAGVSRQTIYRWWSTKAEILLEASSHDAAHELAVPQQTGPVADLTAYVQALAVFLTKSDAGAAYRALIGEAQHDSAVASLLRGRDLLGESAATVIGRALSGDALRIPMNQATALLIGPVFYWLLSGRSREELDVAAMVEAFLSVAAPGLGRA